MTAIPLDFLTASPSHSSSIRRSDSAIRSIAESPRHTGLIRLGVITYVCALLLIAAFSIAFHFITDSIVHRQDDTARIVNISGRQRMLSQRIARLALERATHTSFRPDAQTQTALLSAIALMESSHQALTHGSAADRITAPQSPTVIAVYTRAPFGLDARMEDFLAHAHAFAARPADTLTLADPDLAAIELAAQEPLLSALNAAVAADQATSEAAIAHLRTVLATLTICMLLILLGEALFLYRPLFRRLGHAHAELITLGRTDPLTGCLNRRAFTHEANALLANAHAGGLPLAVLMIDIDRFKSINDRFGHHAGDQAINAVVKALLRGTRTGNVVCRMGGEEFAILLNGATLNDARAAADHLRFAIAAHPVALSTADIDTQISVTVSIGAADLGPTDKSIFTLLARADKALYAAKQNGRNRVEIEPHTALPAFERQPLPA